MDIKKMTPMMEQWHACKIQAKDAVLLFRMGDFYEAFYDDAKLIAEALELTLTKRQEIPMSGVPWHTAELYIERLISKGFKVAIAEQTEDPKKAKGLVSREVVRFITPGTLIDSSSVSEKTNNFIAALTRLSSLIGLASLDLSTGTFQVIELEDEREVLNELYRLKPKEIVVSNKFFEKNAAFLKEVPGLITKESEWRFDHKTAYGYLAQHFKTLNLDGFGLKGWTAAINAAGALLAYIHEVLSLPIHHIREIKPLSLQDTLSIDQISQRNLELIDSLQEEGRKYTLLNVVDLTQTPMGGRLLKDWIKKPLLSVREIHKRQEAIEAFFYTERVRIPLQKELKEVRDLERLMMKVSSGLANPRDLLSLGNSLEKIGQIKALIEKNESELIRNSHEKLMDVSDLVMAIKNAVVEEPPIRLSDGNIFKEGYNQELDQLRDITKGGKNWLSSYQTKIKEETKIKNLKVSYNKIFGYYIEVSRGQASLMPANFERRQTLVNSERFISEELKEYEIKVLTAEEKIQEKELELFQNLTEKIATEEQKIFGIAKAISLIDVLVSLASTSKKYGYTKPIIDESDILEIKGGRHPVLESVLGKECFIPNDTELNGKTKSLMIITGPNMAGKSTYIRQVALIVILAQMGSFVPADFAHIGVVDRIFTRIGANDNLSRGQSTFMVEMNETAHILNNVTPKSLVILDEIGRGTSTYDGISIAWSAAEFLLEKKAKTLFATHYWELTELGAHFPSVFNAHAQIEERGGEITFLHKILEGPADRSYGIHVAKLAGVPLSVIRRAKIILNKLEARQESYKRIKKEKADTQLSLF